MVLLALAALPWMWRAVLLLTPYEADRADYQQPTECEPRLLTERGTPDDGLFHPGLWREGARLAAGRPWQCSACPCRWPGPLSSLWASSAAA